MVTGNCLPVIGDFHFRDLEMTPKDHPRSKVHETLVLTQLHNHKPFLS